MQSLSDTPDETLVPTSATSKEDKAAAIESVGKIIIQEFVDFEFHKEKPKAMKAGSGNQPKKAVQNKQPNLDHIQEYAKELFTLGLFYLELQDGIREGNELRVLRCWKYLFLFFRATSHVNYTIEAFTLSSQYYYLLPPRLSEQLIWSRFV